MEAFTSNRCRNADLFKRLATYSTSIVFTSLPFYILTVHSRADYTTRSLIFELINNSDIDKIASHCWGAVQDSAHRCIRDVKAVAMLSVSFPTALQRASSAV